jgi:hypothetical protein
MRRLLLIATAFLANTSLHAQANFDCVAPAAPVLTNPVVLGNGSAGSVSAVALQAALNVGGEIRLNIGTSTLALTQQLSITRATTLDGNGATLSGGNTNRLIDISNPQLATYTFNLLNIDLIDGNAQNADGNEVARSGGGILDDHGSEPWRAMRVRLFHVRIASSDAIQTAQDGGGGGLYVVGLKELTLVDSVIEDNSGSNGGGLYSLGTETLNLFDTTVSGNLASGTGGNPGMGGNAGGIGVDGDTRNVNLCRVRLTGNEAHAYGAGLFTTVYDQTSFTRIEDSTIASNNNSGTSNSHTGGVYLQGGPFLIQDSTFRANQATGYGGLALFDHQTGNGLITTSGTVINSTFVGNLARTGLGGAMNISATGSILLQNLTIADNRADCAVCFAGGIQNSPGLAITLRNSILHNNTGGNAFNPWNIRNPVAGSNNVQFPLVRPGSFGQMEVAATPDTVFADALLAAPANNGGPTETLALAALSPAVDTGIATGALALDQRGLPRVGNVDLGAYELQPAAALFQNGFE